MATKTKIPNETRPSAIKATVLVMIVMLSSIFGWMISGVIHETGHALAVLSFGGVITEFQPLVLVGAPHITYMGSFSSIQKATISVSGAGTVYLIGLLVLSFFPFRKTNPGISLTLTMGIVPFVAQSISFIVLPILHLLGVTIRDDVINFIEYSGFNPLWVALGASLLAFLAASVIARHTRIVSTIQMEIKWNLLQ